MTPARSTHRTRSLALSSLNRIRTVSLLHQARQSTSPPPGTGMAKRKNFGRLIPGRGRKEAVKVALTLSGENVWLVRGKEERKKVETTIVEEVEETDLSISLAITQAFEEMNSPLIPLSTLSRCPDEDAGALSDVEEVGLGTVDEEDDWEVLERKDLEEGDKGKDEMKGRRWVPRLYR